MSMSNNNSPCAACKCLRRKCTHECPFAPYFPPDNPQKFTNVHKVFGASNVAKLLNDISASNREDAVNSLAYEAECRLRDPVYGCVGLISILQHKLKQVQHDLETAKKELSTYVGPTAMLSILNHATGIAHHHPPPPPPHPNIGFSGYQQTMPYNNNNNNTNTAQHMLTTRDQHQFLEAQQLAAAAAAAAAREQEMLKAYELQHHHQQIDLMKFDCAPRAAASTAAGLFNHQMPADDIQLQPSLALGSAYETLPYQQSDPHSHPNQSRHLLMQQEAVSSSHRSHPQQQLVLQGLHSQPQLMTSNKSGHDDEDEDDEDKNSDP